MNQKPSLGRIVRYGGDEPNTAIITQVNLSGTVNLTVFLPDGTIEGKKNVIQASGPKHAAKGTWWWPERV